MMRQAILDSVPSWPDTAQCQRETVLAPGAASAAAQKRRHKLLAAIDYMCSTAEDSGNGFTQQPDQQVCSLSSHLPGRCTQWTIIPVSSLSSSNSAD